MNALINQVSMVFFSWLKLLLLYNERPSRCEYEFVIKSLVLCVFPFPLLLSFLLFLLLYTLLFFLARLFLDLLPQHFEPMFSQIVSFLLGLFPCLSHLFLLSLNSFYFIQLILKLFSYPLPLLCQFLLFFLFLFYRIQLLLTNFLRLQ